LGNVIYSLKNLHQKSQKQKKSTPTRKPQGGHHIPYRDSKLTHILKDSLGGNTDTHIIITLSPSEDSLYETLSSMQFAHNAKSVK
jgi:hypothetical protein